MHRARSSGMRRKPGELHGCARLAAYLAEMWLNLVILLKCVSKLLHVLVKLQHILAVFLMDNFQHPRGFSATHAKPMSPAVVQQLSM